MTILAPSAPAADNAPHTITDTVPDWLRRLAGRQLSPRTIETYRKDLVRFAHWLTQRLGRAATPADITPRAIEDWQDDHAHLNGASHMKLISALHSYCAWAARRRLLADDPTELVERPRRPDVLPRALTTTITTNPVLVDLIPAYHAYLVGELRRPQGIKAYINALRRVFAWLGPDATLADLDQQAMLRYKAQCGTLAPSSMVKSLATVRDFAFWAASAGYAFTDPTLGIRRPRRRRPDPRPLTTEEVGQLLQAIAIPEGLTPLQHARWSRNRLMILTYLYTGARLTELARLTWRHIRLDAGIIEIKNGKGGKDRTIPIHPVLARELAAVPAAQRQPHMTFYQRADRQPAGEKSLCHIFDRWLKDRIRAALGAQWLHVHCHMLRATFANHLITSDVDLITTQELMGHANLDTLMHYVKSDLRRKRAGIERLPDFGSESK